MRRRQTPDLVSWRKDNPTLTEVANHLRRIDNGEGVYCIFSGSFLDLFDGQTYQFPAGFYVNEVSSMKGEIAVHLPECNAQWWVQPVEPFTFEIVGDDGTFSLEIYDISAEEWPLHIQQWHEEFADEIPLSDEKPEALTRMELIDPALVECGWTDAMIGQEWTFTSKVDDTRNRVDYVLSVIDENRRTYHPIAFIEAKHRGLVADYGLEQAKRYGDRAQAQIRFVFATNGLDFVQFDRLTGATSAVQPLDRFPTPAGLRKQWLGASRQIDKPIHLEKLSIPRSGLDPTSIEHARNVAELLLPAEVRLPCLELIGEVILYANELGAGKWEVTLEKSGRFIRINVGKLEIGGIFPNMVHLIVDDEALTEADKLTIGRYAELEGPTIYDSVPSSMSCDFRADQINIVKPLIWAAYQSLIRKAAGTVKRRTGYHNYHASGVVAYLREATNQAIPDPNYSMD